MQPDRPPFEFIGIEQPRASPAMNRGGQSPGQIDRIAQAGVHPQAAGRDDQMNRVTRQENSPIRS